MRFALPLVPSSLLVVLLLSAAGDVGAGTADVLAAKVQCRPAPGGRPASVCQFTVTVKHGDTGWDHYANRFEIVSPTGEVLATRILRHPHVDEQPFTRSLARVRIQHSVSDVQVRAGDLVHGLGGAAVTVSVPHVLALESNPKEPAGASPQK